MTARERVRLNLERYGPATAEQLAKRTRMDIYTVRVALCELSASGDLSRRKVYQWRAAGGTCDWPGCDTVLRASNTSGYCGSHKDAAARIAWAMLPERAQLKALSTVPPSERLETLERLGLEAVTAP